MRCHNGFIVNKSNIKTISSMKIEILHADKNIPVGRGYKKSVIDYFSE